MTTFITYYNKCVISSSVIMFHHIFIMKSRMVYYHIMTRFIKPFKGIIMHYTIKTFIESSTKKKNKPCFLFTPRQKGRVFQSSPPWKVSSKTFDLSELELWRHAAKARREKLQTHGGVRCERLSLTCSAVHRLSREPSGGTAEATG